MRKLTSFNFITLNGFFKDSNDDITWHKHGGEEAEFSAESLKSGNILLFGRATYQQMESFWPTQMAAENFPVVAEMMNKAEKIVFTKTLKKTGWNNTRILNENIVEEVKKLKQLPGKDLAILGSGSLITQFTDAGLIDEYQLMIDPVAIGSGTALFKNIKRDLNLKLTTTRIFKSGTILLYYQPV